MNINSIFGNIFQKIYNSEKNCLNILDFFSPNKKIFIGNPTKGRLGNILFNIATCLAYSWKYKGVALFPKLEMEIDGDYKDIFNKNSKLPYHNTIFNNLIKIPIYLDEINYNEKYILNKNIETNEPYVNKEKLNALITNTEWKKQYNLPHIQFIIKQMIPNRWKNVPLGERNKLDTTKPAYFIIFDSLVTENEIVKKTNESKMWPQTEVVDWSKCILHFDYKKSLSEVEMIDYVEALLYRYLLGISDLADRNFLMHKGRIISIDGDINEHDVNLYVELKKNKANFVYNWIKNNYEKLKIGKWSHENKTKLDIIQNYDKCVELFVKKIMK